MGLDLIGRDAELTELRAFLAALSGTPAGLMIRGEPGIGKTSLWRAGLALAEQTGHRILRSTPSEAESALPFTVLGDLLDSLPDDAFESLTSPLRTALEVALFRRPAEQEPTDQHAVSRALLRLFHTLAASAPILVAIDDVQWADRASLRVMGFALRRLEEERVRLLCSLRRPGSAAIPAEFRASVLDVGPMSLPAIDEVLLQRLDRPLRRPELDRVYATSAGNPFFALEIARFILAHPVKPGQPLPLPASLTDAIEGRLRTLSTAAQVVKGDDPMSALGRIAISPHPFDRWLAQQIERITGIELSSPSPPPNAELWSWERTAVRA